MGLSIPEAYGGFGASAKVYNRVFDACSRMFRVISIEFNGRRGAIVGRGFFRKSLMRRMIADNGGR